MDAELVSVSAHEHAHRGSDDQVGYRPRRQDHLDAARTRSQRTDKVSETEEGRLGLCQLEDRQGQSGPTERKRCHDEAMGDTNNNAWVEHVE